MGTAITVLSVLAMSEWMVNYYGWVSVAAAKKAFDRAREHGIRTELSSTVFRIRECFEVGIPDQIQEYMNNRIPQLQRYAFEAYLDGIEPHQDDPRWAQFIDSLPREDRVLCHEEVGKIAYLPAFCELGGTLPYLGDNHTHSIPGVWEVISRLGREGPYGLYTDIRANSPENMQVRFFTNRPEVRDLTPMGAKIKLRGRVEGVAKDHAFLKHVFVERGGE
jgi:hypothetical protein